MLKFNEDFPEGEITKMLFNNDLAKKYILTNECKYPTLLIRLLRTAYIGQILFDEGVRKIDGIELNTMKSQGIASQCELYLFYMRTVYDYLMKYFLKKTNVNFPYSYAKFIVKNIESLKSDFCKVVMNKTSDEFLQLRCFRDTIKQKDGFIQIYVEEGGIMLMSQLYDREGKKKEVIREKMWEWIFRTSFDLSVVMHVISLEVEEMRVGGSDGN